MIKMVSDRLATTASVAILVVGLTVVLNASAGANSETSREQGCVSATTRNGGQVVCYGSVEDDYHSLAAAKSYLEGEGASFEFVPCIARSFVAWHRTGFFWPDTEYITDEGQQPTGAPDQGLPGRWVAFSPDTVISRCGRLFSWKIDGWPAIMEPDAMSQGRPSEPLEGEPAGAWVELRLENGFYTSP